MNRQTAHTLQMTRYRRFNAMPGVRFEQHNDLLAMHVDNDSATATVFLQGAQLTHYQRHGEPPVIWCSPQCDYQRGAPLRGGIPICWPWFGSLETNPLAIRRQVPVDIASAHGFVRNRVWTLDTVEQPDNHLTRVVLSLELDGGQGDPWPMASGLQLIIEIGDRLRMELVVDNRSDTPYYFSAALHTYYAVSDIDNVSVRGLERLNYLDCARGWTHGRQREPLVIDRETDRIYHGTWQPLTLVDRGWNRALCISSDGSDSAVVWNPWEDKAKRLSHFADDAYREMLCIETANTGEDFVVLKPYKQHRLGFSVRSRPLGGA